MSEVKPTLIFDKRKVASGSWIDCFSSYEWANAQSRSWAWITAPSYNQQALYQNTWQSNFPSGTWLDAQGRSGFWVMSNSVSVNPTPTNAYNVNIIYVNEYRISFDQPVDNFTLIFPYVVKTSDGGIKKVFIEGVEYPVRDFVNYGDMFVVSGREFRFRIATKYKLRKDLVPIIWLDFKHATFECVALLNSNCVRVRYLSSEFDTANTITTNYTPIRSVSSTFITSIATTWNYVRVHNALSVFNNINNISVPVIANCKATSWDRFGGIWKSCNAWTQ